MSDLLTAALELHAAGCCVLPAAQDSTKRPEVPWRDYQQRRPDEAQLRRWFSGSRTGLGIVCGAISGNLELAELEARAVEDGALATLLELATESDLTDLWGRVTVGGYVVRSPSGGVHLLYRIADGAVPGNTKLAALPDHTTLAETRGEGGWVVTAPSHGAVHPSGHPWQVVTGGPATIPTLTMAERDELHRLFRQLDQRPAPAPATPFSAHSGGAADGGISPGDDFSARASWPEILEPAGWRRLHTRGQITYWRRPGKDTGISASTGYGDGDWFFPFTSSTAFEPERTYTKLGAYAVLHHGGDHTAAARDLQTKGYGQRPPAERPRLVHSAPAAAPTDGATALAVKQAGADIPAQVVASLTDHGNAQLLVATHGHRLRYVPSRGQWLTWTGQRWAWCEDDGEPMQAATNAIQALQPRDDAERKHQHRSLSRRSLEAAIALGRRDARLRVTADQLDADPYVLNTPSGVVDLRTGQATAHAPEQLHTRITGVPYQQHGPAPRWQQFLHDTFDGDQEMVDFVQRLAGYSALGEVTHHVLPFLFGPGGNGKSVFLDVLIATLGDYASTAPADFLMAGGRDDENAVARLSGLRLVICSEVDPTARFNESKIKVLTGGDRLTARFLYQRHFTFTPTHTLWLMANHQPRVDAGGESFWRRLRLLPFTAVVPKEKRVEGLANQLVAAEGAGILAWIVDGARQAIATGLNEPAAVMEATARYAEEEDAVARFVAERCHIGGGALARVATRDMRASYETWCRDEGQRPISAQMFGREIRARYGVADARSNGRRYYTGVTLLQPEDDGGQGPFTPQSEHWTDR